MLKRVIILMAAAVLAGTALNGCSSSDDPTVPTPTAKIRVVHSAPGSDAVDVYLGAATEPWLEDLAYGDASIYKIDSPRTVTLVFRTAGSASGSDPVFTSDPIELASGVSVTMLAAGLVESSAPEDEFRLIRFDDSFQNSGVARARIFHVGADAPTVTVTIGDDGRPLAPNLERWTESTLSFQFLEVDMEHDILIQAAGNQSTSFRTPKLAVNSDYYFFLTGLITGAGSQATPLDLLIVGPGGAVALETIESRGYRLVHTVSDGGSVDAYTAYGMGDNFQRVQMEIGVVYGEVTEYSEVSIRQIFVEIYARDATPGEDQPLFSDAAYIHEDGLSTTVFVAGLASGQTEDDEVRLFSVADDFSLSPAGFYSARVVHTCPNLDDLNISFDNNTSNAQVGRYGANGNGTLSLTAGAEVAMSVLEGFSTVDFFTVPPFAEQKQLYLVLTGIKNGVPDFSLLSVSQDGSEGFTSSDIF